MIKLISLFSSILILSISATAEVESDYLFNCNLNFTATGKSVYIVAGYTHAKGKGKLSCFDYLTGNTEHIPIKITVKGIGLGIGVTGINISGAAIGIGIKKNPESLLGTYVQVKAGAAIGQGVATSAGLRFNLKKGAVLITASVNGQSGLGAGVDILSVDIERRHKHHRPAHPIAPIYPKPEPPIYKPKHKHDHRHKHKHHHKDKYAHNFHYKKVDPNVDTIELVVKPGQKIELVDKHGKVVKRLYVK